MFTDRGLTTGDIPLAFVLHEAVGISLAIAMVRFPNTNSPVALH